jgi:hypothetical protein
MIYRLSFEHVVPKEVYSHNDLQLLITTKLLSHSSSLAQLSETRLYDSDKLLHSQGLRVNSNVKCDVL